MSWGAVSQSSRASNGKAGHTPQRRELFGQYLNPKYRFTWRNKPNNELMCTQDNQVQWHLAGVRVTVRSSTSYIIMQIRLWPRHSQCTRLTIEPFLRMN